MNDLVRIPKAELSKCGMLLQPNLSFTDWMAAGRALASIQEAAQWWAGDWAAYGQKQYEQKRYTEGKYSEALQVSTESLSVSALAHQTVFEFACVADAFPPERRRANLSFKHHREVAFLDKAKQDAYLDMAEAMDWTFLDLRKHIRTSEAGYKSQDDRQVGFSFTSWVHTGLHWVQKQEIAEWTADQKAALKRDLRPLVEIYEAL
jgi:hypothetical protein